MRCCLNNGKFSRILPNVMTTEPLMATAGQRTFRASRTFGICTFSVEWACGGQSGSGLLVNVSRQVSIHLRLLSRFRCDPMCAAKLSRLSSHSRDAANCMPPTGQGMVTTGTPARLNGVV